MPRESSSKRRKAVYRVYNPNKGGMHVYTTNASEVNLLKAAGWTAEGTVFYTASANGTPVYRLYNPNSTNGQHHYTSSVSEKNYLVSIGWKYEGVAWYSE